MPIFAYRCQNCGFEKDVLQKRSDPPLEQCPSCGNDTFRKQVSAPAFQLKGSGWYVTDFRDKGKGADAAGKTADATPADAKPADAKPADAPAAGAAGGASDKAGAAAPVAAKPSESPAGTKPA